MSSPSPSPSPSGGPTAGPGRGPGVGRAATALPTVQPRRLSQLGMGVRLAVTGGRNSLARTVLTALGIGIGVAMLLLASSFPAMKDHRDDRIHAIVDTMHGDRDMPRSDRTLLLVDASTRFHDIRIRGRIVQPEGPATPLPPGLDHYPRPGELSVSPALAELLREPGSALLRERLDHPVTGRVGEAGLVGPGDFTFFLGSDSLGTDTGAMRLDSFGDVYPPRPLDPYLVLLSVVGIVVVLTPVVVFVAAAARFGGEGRDRRLAALRLVGADRSMTAVIAAGEALAGAGLGLVLGWLFFLLCGRLGEYVTIAGMSVFAEDVDPEPVLAAAAMAAVPALAVLTTLVAMRRVVVEPLAVSRGDGRVRRRLWWRLALLAAGGALLSTASTCGLARLSTDQGMVVLVVGMILLLTGVAAMLPAVLEHVTRRISGGPPSWQLAVGRLRLDGGSAARTTSAVVAAVAAGIALQSLFGGVTGLRDRQFAQDVAETGVRMDEPDGHLNIRQQGDRAGDYTVRLRDTPGTRSVIGYTAFYARMPDGRGTVDVRAADCRTLSSFAALPSCSDGDAFVIRSVGYGQADTTSWPGAEMTTGHGAPHWQLPSAVPSVPAMPGVFYPAHGTVLLVTPSVVPAQVLGPELATVEFRLDSAVPDAKDQLRNAVARIGPGLAPTFQDETVRDEDRPLLAVERALSAAVTVALVLLSGGMLVGALEQLRERRRALACQVAFGTRRRTLAWSVLWQTAFPMVLGLLLASAIGVGMGTALLRLARMPAHIDTAGVLAAAGAGAAAVLVVTALTLPALLRLSRPDGLRFE
ncbi:ABC transporter permease [Kitasatospora sp. NPDC050543]|uniref:ABC transporter permease n=1 Tax=Kitasatospora sp. NPDC050543 TaxID=3364054 RepID=UPI00379471D5